MDNLKPLVSVIIPTYNRSNIILETLNRVLEQTYTNIEIIVISDGSTDDTKNIIEKKNDNRVTFVELNQNTGLPAVVRNTGIELAKGKYIAFCDDDDLWLPNKIDIQVSILEKDPTIGLVCCSCLFLYPNGKVEKQLSLISQVKHFIVALNIIPAKYLLMTMNFVINSSVLMIRDVEGLGFLSEKKEHRGSEDFEYWLRVVRMYKIKYLNKPLLYYRIHASQLISVDGRGKENFLRILNQYEKNLLQVSLFNLRYLVYRITNF